VEESGKKLSASKEVRIIGKENGYLKLAIGSGKYRFCTPWKNSQQVSSSTGKP
jgi:hypothetical protein